MSIILIYLTGIFFLIKVIFPLFSFSKKKENSIVFNLSPFIDIINLLIICLALGLVIYVFMGSKWYDWLYFIFPLIYFLLESVQILFRWHSEIIIDDEFIYIRERKNIKPTKFRLNDSRFIFFKDWNNEDITEVIKWKKIIRATYVQINKETFNLNELRLNAFSNQIIHVIKKNVNPEKIEIKFNFFEKIGGVKYLYSFLFALSIIYHFFILN
ncbi:hypothetical protein OAF64_05610 [Crocinitomicaceae bacterium]|nr:hypothetical protein [Crocinitomicaceae bacterium]